MCLGPRTLSDPANLIAAAILRESHAKDLNSVFNLADAIERAIGADWRTIAPAAHQIHDGPLKKAARNLGALGEEGFERLARGEADPQLTASLELIYERTKRKTK